MKKRTSKSLDLAICVKKLGRYCDELACLLAALAHPKRLLIMGHLLQGEKNVSELLKEFRGLSQPQLSQFLIMMKDEGLVKSRREGRHLYYSPHDERIKKLMIEVQKIFCEGPL